MVKERGHRIDVIKNDPTFRYLAQPRLKMRIASKLTICMTVLLSGITRFLYEFFACNYLLVLLKLFLVLLTEVFPFFIVHSVVERTIRQCACEHTK